MNFYIDKVMGCLYGGAIGDALGYPVEFLRKEEIVKAYGRGGIRDYALMGGKALMSDDTQMTLFTLSGLLAWREDRERDKDKDSWNRYVWGSYRDWLFTQDEKACPDPPRISWLADEPVMHAQRAPGLTCLSALKRESPRYPANDSKGCGSVMRIAPAAFWHRWDYSCDVCMAGAEMAAMTHGHPLGIICAAAFVGILEHLLEGKDLQSAIAAGSYEVQQSKLSAWGEFEEFREIMGKAVSLSKSSLTDQEAIEEIGEGWVAEEALAIAIFCSLRNEGDFAATVAAAVNHGGDSDSTGAIAGNLMGAVCGYRQIPVRFLERLEAKEVLDRLASELARKIGSGRVWERIKSGRYFTEYTTKHAVRFNQAFVLEEPDEEKGGILFEYLLLYQRDDERGLDCRLRLGSRRFITIRHVAEDSLQVALYIKREGEKPDYHLESLLPEKKGEQLRFDAEKYLKDRGLVFHPADKETYDAYAFEFRYYTNGTTNNLSRAHASGGGLFYWTYAWLDCSLDELKVRSASRQIEWEDGHKSYTRCMSWGGPHDDESLNDELQWDAENKVLEIIGLTSDCP